MARFNWRKARAKALDLLRASVLCLPLGVGVAAAGGPLLMDVPPAAEPVTRDAKAIERYAVGPTGRSDIFVMDHEHVRKVARRRSVGVEEAASEYLASRVKAVGHYGFWGWQGQVNRVVESLGTPKAGTLAVIGVDASGVPGLRRFEVVVTHDRERAKLRFPADGFMGVPLPMADKQGWPEWRRFNALHEVGHAVDPGESIEVFPRAAGGSESVGGGELFADAYAGLRLLQDGRGEGRIRRVMRLRALSVAALGGRASVKHFTVPVLAVLLERVRDSAYRKRLADMEHGALVAEADRLRDRVLRALKAAGAASMALPDRSPADPLLEGVDALRSAGLPPRWTARVREAVQWYSGRLACRATSGGHSCAETRPEGGIEWVEAPEGLAVQAGGAATGEFRQGVAGR